MTWKRPLPAAQKHPHRWPPCHPSLLFPSLANYYLDFVMLTTGFFLFFSFYHPWNTQLYVNELCCIYFHVLLPSPKIILRVTYATSTEFIHICSHIVFNCINNIWHLFIHSTVDDNAIPKHVSWRINISVFVGCRPRNGIAGSLSMPIFKFNG